MLILPHTAATPPGLDATMLPPPITPRCRHISRESRRLHVTPPATPMPRPPPPPMSQHLFRRLHGPPPLHFSYCHTPPPPCHASHKSRAPAPPRRGRDEPSIERPPATRCRLRAVTRTRHARLRYAFATPADCAIGRCRFADTDAAAATRLRLSFTLIAMSY